MNDTGVLGGTQDPNDPYATGGIEAKLISDIKNAILSLKAHPHQDITSVMNKIFGEMQSLQGMLVGQSSETQNGLTTAITGIANLQRYGADKDGTPVQDINIFTGKPKVDKDGNAVMVSPEKAFKDQSEFLLNSPNTRDKLDKDGKRIPAIGANGKPVLGKDGKPTYLENPLYKFTHTKGNESVADQLKSAAEGAVTSLGDGSDYPATTGGSSGYVIDPKTGKVDTDPTTGDPTGSFEKVSIKGDSKVDGKYPTDGAINNMWTKANPPPSTTGTPTTPNSSILNSFQSAMGTLGQAGTASSSTLQAYIKVLTDNLTASQGNYNKALTATINQLKVMVQAQRTGG